jgi:hypothetical protein
VSTAIDAAATAPVDDADEAPPATDTADDEAPTSDGGPPATPPPETSPPETPPAETSPPETGAPPATDAAEPAPLGGRRLPEALDAASDVDTNPLPDLVVADVGRGAEVNLRNVFPAERPVLVWMWAPH